jgi:hypothetical protein
MATRGQLEVAAMRTILTSTVFAFAMALTAMPVNTAAAQDLELHLGNEGPIVRFRDDCDPRYEYCRDRDRYRHDRDEHRRERWERRRECTPDRALDKAERMGIWRARIGHIGRRSIEVRGRSRGGWVSVRFDRWDRHCRVRD